MIVNQNRVSPTLLRCHDRCRASPSSSSQASISTAAPQGAGFALRARRGGGAARGRALCGHSAPGAPAQVASIIILWAAPGGPDGARSCSQLAEAHRGTVPRAPGRIWLGRVISTRMPTRRDADGRAARAASMVWCRLGRHFAPVRQGVNHPVCADMSGLRGPVPLRCVLPSLAGQDHRSWVRPAGGLRVAGSVCPSSDFLGLFSGVLPAPCGLSNSACRYSCAPPPRHPGPWRSHHHHPSPGRPPASISTL